MILTTTGGLSMYQRAAYDFLVNTEVVIALKGQDTLVAIVTTKAAKDSSRPWARPWNVILATDVILGVACIARGGPVAMTT